MAPGATADKVAATAAGELLIDEQMEPRGVLAPLDTLSRWLELRLLGVVEREEAPLPLLGVVEREEAALASWQTRHVGNVMMVAEPVSVMDGPCQAL
mmetsp:Transcript_88620/g.229980  ORF Transcript_88620/g.229980 Transcript_88620/m.229980 type:complete len:97 (-) Transcript_88620:250-540(-)